MAPCSRPQRVRQVRSTRRAGRHRRSGLPVPRLGIQCGHSQRMEGSAMCVDNDSRPPIHPIAGGSAGSRDLPPDLGRRHAVHGARGARGQADRRRHGRHPRRARPAHRTTRSWPTASPRSASTRWPSTSSRARRPPRTAATSFDFMAQVPQTKPETLQADIAAAAAYLRGADGGQVKSLFSVGFCFGGALSYLQAASGLGYAGVIGFYGWPLGPQALARSPQADRRRGPLQVRRCCRSSAAPTRASRRPTSTQFDAACKKANVKHDTKVYPGRAPQLLRPQVRRVRRRLGRRVEARADLRRSEHQALIVRRAGARRSGAPAPQTY